MFNFVIAYLCTVGKCESSFADLGEFFAHAQAHESAGDGPFEMPYPWHCPYPSVVETLQRGMSSPSCVDGEVPL